MQIIEAALVIGNGAVVCNTGRSSRAAQGIAGTRRTSGQRTIRDSRVTDAGVGTVGLIRIQLVIKAAQVTAGTV